VTVTDDDGNEIGNTTADGNGTWTVTPADALTDGQYTITATQTDKAGNTSGASDPVTFTVDAVAPTPNIDTPNGLTDATAPTFTGTGENGDTVTLSVDGQAVTPTATVANGEWSITLAAPLSAGDHTVTATQARSNGVPSGATAPVSFTVGASQEIPVGP